MSQGAALTPSRRVVNAARTPGGRRHSKSSSDAGAHARAVPRSRASTSNNPAKIRRQRRGVVHRLAASRMGERQPRGVQCLAMEMLERGLEFRRRARRQAPPTAVHRIADDRISHVRQVHADLVRAPGLELHARQRVSAKTLLDAVMRDRLAPVAAHRHFRTLRAMPADGLIDGAAAGHGAGAQRQVFALDFMRRERRHQRRVRLERARHD